MENVEICKKCMTKPGIDQKYLSICCTHATVKHVHCAILLQQNFPLIKGIALKSGLRCTYSAELGMFLFLYYTVFWHFAGAVFDTVLFNIYVRSSDSFAKLGFEH